MAKKKKLSAKQKIAREKASRRRRNKRYYLKKKIYKEYVETQKKRIAAKAVHVKAIATYSEFWRDVEYRRVSGKLESKHLKTSELEGEAKRWIDEQVILNRRTARSGRENLFKKVRYSINQHASMLKTMTSSTGAIAYIRHLANNQGSLSWKDYVAVVSLAGCIIGGYVKARGDAQHGFRLVVVGQPTIEEFRYISGNWRFAKDFIRLKLGRNEEEAYGS